MLFTFYKQIVSFIKSIFFVFRILGKPPGYDRVRNAEIGNKDFELDVMEEAYTSEHWIVRIYKVKDYPNRGV
jgi:hypothetical protein